MKIYHVYLGEKRTTVSLNDTLSGLMAVRLRTEPETQEAHSAIRQWLQAKLDEYDDPGRAYVSRWLQSEATLFVSDKMLSRKYLDWYLTE